MATGLAYIELAAQALVAHFLSRHERRSFFFSLPTVSMAALLNNLFGGSKPSASPIPAGDSGMLCATSAIKDYS